MHPLLTGYALLAIAIVLAGAAGWLWGFLAGRRHAVSFMRVVLSECEAVARKGERMTGGPTNHPSNGVPE